MASIRDMAKDLGGQINPRSPDYDPKVAAGYHEEVGRRRGERAGKKGAKLKQQSEIEEAVARGQRWAFRTGKRQGAGAGAAAQESRDAALRRQAFAKDLRALDAYVSRLQGQAGRARVSPTPGPRKQYRWDRWGRGWETGSFGQIMTRRVAYTMPRSGGESRPGTFALDRTTGTRIIIICSALSAVTIMLTVKGSDVIPVLGKNNKDTLLIVNSGVRQYAALVIITIIALILNEITPPLAVGMMVLLLFSIGLRTGTIDRLGRAMQNTAPVTVTAGGTAGEDLTGWIHTHLGQWPHPGKGRNDFWNAIAEADAKDAGVPMQGKP